MTKTISKMIAAIGAIVLIVTTISCEKKAEDTTSANIATEVVANLASISANYAPPSLTSAAVSIQSNPCEGVTNFAICQSNLIREYNRIGKEAVDATSTIVNALGQALGNVPDGNSGTSENGKISWNKTSAQVWSVLFRGTGDAPQSYISINNNVYTVKSNKNVDATEPLDQQIEITVTFTNSETWDVDVFFGNNVCDATDPKGPTKARLKVGLANNLWKGRAMLYTPRWEAPGAATVTCASGLSEIAMYTDYVGNSTSSKAELYLIPLTAPNLNTIDQYDLSAFCTNFASNCNGDPGEPTGGFLSAYPNPFCSTGPNTNPTWNDNCSTNNTAVSGASYSASAWVTPSDLKVYTVTVPSSL